MFLLVLRRYRAQIWVLGLLTIALCVAFVVHGLQVVELLRDGALPPGPAGEPETVTAKYLQLSQFLPYLLIVPGLVGAFWGAPLVSRELELQTMHFVWAQTVSRRRWFGWYVGLLSLILIVLSTLLGSAIAWWLSRFDGFDLPGVGDDPSLLPLRGLALTGWWLLAFGMGTLTGSLVRRTLAAMGITVGAVIGVLFLVQNWQLDLLVGAGGLDLHPTTATVVVFGAFSLTAVLMLLGSWWVVRRTSV